MRLTITTDDNLKFEQQLNRFSKLAVPIANQQALNEGAFTAQKVARAIVERDMIQRNKFTIRSIQVHKSPRTLQISMQSSAVGSTQKYMADQEFGGIKKKKGKHGVPLPTSFSAGQGKRATRTRLPQKKHKLQNIKFGKKIKFKNDKQRNAVAIAMAARTGGGHVFLKSAKTTGIYKVTGGLTKTGRKRKTKIRMTHNLEHKSVTIPQSRWLKPAVDRTRPAMKLIYYKALQFQVNRMRLFK